MRWTVERPRGGFEDVGADSLVVHPSGALVFYGEGYTKLLVIAPGQWITVTPDED